MKKLLGIVVLGLLLSGNAYAKPVLLECKEDEPLDQDQDFYAYYSLDFDKKKYLYKAGVWVAKNCALGNCKEIRKELYDLYKERGLISKKNNNIFTDKSLNNFFYLKLIKKIYPNSKIINCKRTNHTPYNRRI